MSTTRRFALGLTGLLLLTAACTGEATTRAPADPSQGLSTVVLLGDSVAAGEAVPLGAAFQAGDVKFRSLAADGGGNVVGPFSEENWPKLPDELAAAHPSVVVYQLTTYDWGSEQEQRAAYEKLLSTVTGIGAKLVFVTSPPIQPDDFYRPHMADLERAGDVARAVAEGSSGRATFLDATEVWGDTYQRTRDGKADRSTDGIHTCPQGAARFTHWLLARLADLFPGFTPPNPTTWANTGWSADDHFTGC
ncbi:SGNH/GDSL hydrolase family protein [Saccharopolyspora rosea]|uniref:SGNH/GDSL hydrolase family protein n=1 Tax=Saccharopolyspora rosea TaxID=524884 RepID=A0ABW3FY99_9PSEU|nr:SGNH/GDSL hydrolase family protein [Saccharopolyspora rosea]